MESSASSLGDNEIQVVSETPKRGANYTTDEDLAVTRAYIHISTDSIVGSEQKEGTFYMRIWELYKQKKPVDASVRPLTSVQTRIKSILKSCVRFSAFHKTVRDLKKSGCNEDDEVRLATALFNHKKVTHPNEDVGKPFKFIKCWFLLRDLPKFQAVQNTPSRNCSDSGSAECDEAESSTPLSTDGSGKDLKQERKRPDGRRKAKEMAALQHMKAKKMKLAETAIKLQERQLAELAERNEILLFSNGPGGANSDMAREFFSLKQKKALIEVKKRMQQTESEDGNECTDLVDGEGGTADRE